MKSEFTTEEKLIILRALAKEEKEWNGVLVNLVPFQREHGNIELADKNERCAQDQLEKIKGIIEKLEL